MGLIYMELYFFKEIAKMSLELLGLLLLELLLLLLLLLRMHFIMYFYWGTNPPPL